MASKFLDLVTELAEIAVKNCGCELVDVEYKKEGQDKILRFYAEKINDRISLDELARINKEISDAIDANEGNIGEENYILEVSSPGVNRVLKKPSDFVRFSGEKVDVSLYESINGQKKFTALLKNYDEESSVFTLEISGEDISIKKDRISKMNLYFEF